MVSRDLELLRNLPVSLTKSPGTMYRACDDVSGLYFCFSFGLFELALERRNLQTPGEQVEACKLNDMANTRTCFVTMLLNCHVTYRSALLAWFTFP